MRFKARGVWIVDSEGEFNLPICEAVYSAKKLVEILNELAGDSEWMPATITNRIIGIWRLISPLRMKNLLKFIFKLI